MTISERLSITFSQNVKENLDPTSFKFAWFNSYQGVNQFLLKVKGKAK